MAPFEVQRRARVFWGKNSSAVLSHRKDEFALDAYAWECGGIWLSPIETALWHDIRALDLVLYPQWPVLRFFADFANPVAKVVVECDGRDFHDAERDGPRQRSMEDAGWTVYRFPGWMCNQDSVVESEDDFGRSVITASECNRKLRDIGVRHGIARRPGGTTGMVGIGDVLGLTIRQLIERAT